MIGMIDCEWLMRKTEIRNNNIEKLLEKSAPDHTSKHKQKTILNGQERINKLHFEDLAINN
jgi:hypothetical protein